MKETRVTLYKSVQVGDRVINLYSRVKDKEKSSRDSVSKNTDTAIKSFGGAGNVTNNRES